MTKFTRLASLAALVAGASTFSTGCVVSDCEDGADNCVQLEPITIYEGDPRTETLTYTAGANLTVKGFNGDISVTTGAAAGQVVVTFRPRTGGKSGQATEAGEEIATQLNLSAIDTNGIVIETSRSNNNSYLASDIEVQLPAEFTGEVLVQQGNGGVLVNLAGVDEGITTVGNSGAGNVDVRGLNAPSFNIEGKFDVAVDVDVFPSVADSSIGATGGTGDIALTVPAVSNGSIQATASDDGVVTGPSPLPDGWTEEAAADNSKTYALGAGGVNLRVFTDASGLGDVTIATK